MEPVIAPKEKVRKPLQVLQPAATDKKTLVGSDRIIRSVQQSKEKAKEDVTKTKNDAPKHKKVTRENKIIQTAREEKIIIEAEDLTSTANPSENYWQVLAGKRKMALVNALEENKELLQRIEKLEEENHIYKEILDQTRTLIEVLQEEIENNRNDINNSLDDSSLI